jgi:hypothetical protein
MSKSSQPPATRPSPRDDTDRYAALVWRAADPTPKKLWFDHPVDALTVAVEYLKDGYQARLSDGAVEYFRGLPRPSANGAGALLTGPPRETHGPAEARFQAPGAPLVMGPGTVPPEGGQSPDRRPRAARAGRTAEGEHSMTVDELTAELENYGGHLEVVVVGPGEDATRKPIADITTASTPEGVVVEIGW